MLQGGSMNPIREGSTGAAVEDIQSRLTRLDYAIDSSEIKQQHFGTSTARAVGKFRLDHNLSLSSDVDEQMWSELVDASYTMGDRTLYLRLPNFHGNDVKQLQTCLNILGFSCGEADGYYGVHTEAAVKEFQESQGSLGDGMAFQDTFDAIERLHHVWEGQKSTSVQVMGKMTFSRAADVLERIHIGLTAQDPISRNIAGRIWNLASATSEKSGIALLETIDNAPQNLTSIFVLSTEAPAKDSHVLSVPTLSCDNIETLPQRLQAVCCDEYTNAHVVRLELPEGLSYDGTFTTSDAQTIAVMLLDALCATYAQ